MITIYHLGLSQSDRIVCIAARPAYQKAMAIAGPEAQRPE